MNMNGKTKNRAEIDLRKIFSGTRLVFLFVRKR